MSQRIACWLFAVATLAIAGCGRTDPDLSGAPDAEPVEASPVLRTPRVLADGPGYVLQDTLAQDNAMLYYQPEGAIWTVAKPGGSPPRQLIESANAEVITVDGGDLIYRTVGGGEDTTWLFRRRIVDTSLVFKKNGIALASPIGFDAESIYVVTPRSSFSAPEEITRINRSTGESSTFFSLESFGEPDALVGTSAGVLWSIPRGVFLVTPDGKERQIYGNGGQRMFAYGDEVWWSYRGMVEGEIWRGSLSGAPPEKIQTGGGPLGEFALSGDRLFWATPRGLSGRKLSQREEVLWIGEDICCVLADSARVYWIANDAKAGTFRLMSLDHEPRDR